MESQEPLIYMEQDMEYPVTLRSIFMKLTLGQLQLQHIIIAASSGVTFERLVQVISKHLIISACICFSTTSLSQGSSAFFWDHVRFRLFWVSYISHLSIPVNPAPYVTKPVLRVTWRLLFSSGSHLLCPGVENHSSLNNFPDYNALRGHSSFSHTTYAIHVAYPLSFSYIKTQVHILFCNLRSLSKLNCLTHEAISNRREIGFRLW